MNAISVKVQVMDSSRKIGHRHKLVLESAINESQTVTKIELSLNKFSDREMVEILGKKFLCTLIPCEV